MSECSDESWLQEFSCFLLAPQTAVDFITTLVGAALAAGIAFYILRNQLRHDLSLAEEQSVRERELSRATAIRPYVDELGRAHLDATRILSSEPSSAVGRDVWNNSHREEHDRLLSLWYERSAIISVLPDEALDRARWRMEEAWRLSHDLTRELVGESTSRETLAAAGLATDALLTPFYDGAKAIGNALISWDGVGTLSLPAEALGPEDERSNEHLTTWKRAAIAEYRQILGQYVRGNSNAERAVRERLERTSDKESQRRPLT